MEEDLEKRRSISFKKISFDELLKLSFYLASRFNIKINSQEVQAKYRIEHDESIEDAVFEKNISKIEGIITKDGGATGDLIHFQCIGNYKPKKEKTFFNKIYFPVASSEKTLELIDELRRGILNYLSK